LEQKSRYGNPHNGNQANKKSRPRCTSTESGKRGRDKNSTSNHVLHFNIQAEPEPESPTLTCAIDSYIAHRSNTLSPSTLRGYRIIQRTRFQDEMPHRLGEIASKEWQGIINKEAGRCSPKTLKNAWGFLRSVIKDATGSYPPEVKLPAIPPPDKPFLTPEQIKVFVSAIYETPYAVAALLALSSLRISEIEALDWKDIPPHPKFIRVAGAVVPDEHNKKIKKQQNKNSTSTRNVPIMIPELAAALERDQKPSGSVMPHDQEQLTPRYSQSL